MKGGSLWKNTTEQKKKKNSKHNTTSKVLPESCSVKQVKIHHTPFHNYDQRQGGLTETDCKQMYQHVVGTVEILEICHGHIVNICSPCMITFSVVLTVGKGLSVTMKYTFLDKR